MNAILAQIITETHLNTLTQDQRLKLLKTYNFSQFADPSSSKLTLLKELLHDLCKIDAAHIIKLIQKTINKSIPIDFVTIHIHNGNTLMHLACIYNATKTLKYLQDTYKKSLTQPIHVISKDGRFPIQDACIHHNIDCVRILFDYSPNLAECRAEHNQTLLHLCLFSGNRHGPLELAKFLLDNGTQINVPTKNTKYTALHTACIKGNPDIVKLLIERGADINALTIDQQTPIDLACIHNNLDCINLLLAAGAETNPKLTMSKQAKAIIDITKSNTITRLPSDGHHKSDSPFIGGELEKTLEKTANISTEFFAQSKLETCQTELLALKAKLAVYEADKHIHDSYIQTCEKYEQGLTNTITQLTTELRTSKSELTECKRRLIATTFRLQKYKAKFHQFKSILG